MCFTLSHQVTTALFRFINRAANTGCVLSQARLPVNSIHTGRFCSLVYIECRWPEKSWTDAGHQLGLTSKMQRSPRPMGRTAALWNMKENHRHHDTLSFEVCHRFILVGVKHLQGFRGDDGGNQPSVCAGCQCSASEKSRLMNTPNLTWSRVQA